MSLFIIAIPVIIVTAIVERPHKVKIYRAPDKKKSREVY